MTVSGESVRSFPTLDAASVTPYLREIWTIPLLTVEEERRWGVRAQRGDPQAYHALVLHNLRLAASIARRYDYPGPEHVWSLADSIQEGNQGLLRAVLTFDPHRGRFTTYASPWIHQRIQRARQQFTTMIRVPSYLHQAMHQLAQVRQEWLMVHGHRPSDTQCAALLDWPLERVEACDTAEHQAHMVSLDRTYGEENEARWDDILPTQQPDDDPALHWEQVALRDEVTDLLAHLTPREATILRMRFGFFDETPHTLQEIATVYHVSRERIRQIEAKALETLRRKAARAARLADPSRAFRVAKSG